MIMLKSSKILFYILLLGGVLHSAKLVSRNDSITWADYSFIQNTQGWLTSENASGLNELSINNISKADITYKKGNGKFVNYYQSDNSYDIGANVESFYRLNPKIVLYGKVSYNNFEGKNMGGSVFIDPYENPFDIVQYSDSTRGNKNLETYQLTGAMSGKIFKNLVLGGKISIIAANYAKDKDLRHKNTLSDLNATVGASYKINSILNIGANYYYRKRIEDMEFKTYGTTGKDYYSLINYGVFFGKKEKFGSDGYTSENSGTNGNKPLLNEYKGGAIQLDITPNKKIDIYNEFAYKKRDGRYGVRSSSTIVYSEHNSTQIDYNGIISYKQKDNLHTLDIHIDNDKLTNLENVYKQEKPQGSINTIIYYYDPIEVGTKETFNAQALYTAYLGIKDHNPKWTLSVGGQFWDRKQKASVYPYYRKQNIDRISMLVNGCRNLIAGDNMYSVMLGFNYSTGSGDAKNDYVYTTPETGHQAPPSLDTMLMREYEYLTCDQVQGHIGFKYSRLIKDIGIKAYIHADYTLTKASKTEYLQGKSFNEFNLTIGCTF